MRQVVKGDTAFAQIEAEVESMNITEEPQD